MAKAIFHEEFNYTDKDVGKTWNVKPSPEPQTRPQAVIDAAIEAKKATLFKSKTKNAGD